MSDKPPEPDFSASGPDEDLERKLRVCFQQSLPQVPPMNVEALLAVAALRRRSQRKPWWTWGVFGMAASVLLAIGISAGWWAGHRDVTANARGNEAAMAALRSQISQELAVALRESQETSSKAQQEALSSVTQAILKDYRSRLADLEADIEHATVPGRAREKRPYRYASEESCLRMTAPGTWEYWPQNAGAIRCAAQ